MSLLVGKKAPNFNVKAVVNSEIVPHFSLDQYVGKQYVILFFYPKDFTFVCPTELVAFQENLAEFTKRETAVIGCSTDTEFCHWTWVNTPRNQGGIQGVTYPLIADTNKTVAMAYDVLAGDYSFDVDSENAASLNASGELVAYRGLFLIDKQGIVQHQLVNNMPLGRSISETLRMIDALQHFEKYGEVCPMNWEKGKQAMKPTHEGVSSYLSKSK